MRSSPNRYKFDNYSSEGDYNPYTGQPGYKPDEFSDPPMYQEIPIAIRMIYNED